MLKLYFGGVADKGIALKNIRYFEEQVKRDLAVLRVYQENLEKGGGSEGSCLLSDGHLRDRYI